MYQPVWGSRTNVHKVENEDRESLERDRKVAGCFVVVSYNTEL